MVDDSIDKIFNNTKNYNFVNNSRRIPKMPVLLPLADGFVEGGMVEGTVDDDGSIDKIIEKYS